MQTLKMLTAAITFASLGVAGTAVGHSSEKMAEGDDNSTVNRSEAIRSQDPEYARDTHTSAYKKTYPDEEPVMGEELSPDQPQELTPSDKDWEDGDQKP